MAHTLGGWATVAVREGTGGPTVAGMRVHMGARTIRRAGARAFVGVALVGIALLTMAVPAHAQSDPEAQAEGTIEPIIECSFLDPGTGLYNTVWGYLNRGAKGISIPVDASNSFDNPGADAGQPTVFANGRVRNAFIVTHKGSSTWTLTGLAVTAPGGECRTNPVPVVGEGAGGLITILVVTVVLGLVAFIRFRPRRA